MLATSPPACPVHVVGKRIERAGRVVYRDPGYRAVAHEICCSGRTVWVMFHGGVASSQEAYVVVRSGDAGRTWRLVSSESYFGVNAPHEFDSYSGPWTIAGPSDAYFTGSCPACGYGTVSLWVTLDGGVHFRRYRVPTLTGFVATSLHVAGDDVTILAKSMLRVGPRTRSATVEIR
ncbi:MAG TPA: hypothetical protein VKP14_00210 [Gaiellaceae bacterium]|nr:hypothetical protein [Gaiellaceae bacterium]